MFIKIITKIIFLVSLQIICFAQLFSQIDSLKTLRRLTKNEIELGRIYNLLSDKYLDIDMGIARKYADSALLIGKKNFDYKIVSDAFVNCANSYYFQGSLDSALMYFEMSYHSILKTRNKNEIAAALNRLGLVYESKSDYSTATEYYYKALKIYEESGYIKGKAEILNNLGVISDALGQTDEALTYYYQSLEHFRGAKLVEGQANVYNNLANLYSDKSQTDTALVFINKSISILMNNNRVAEAATAYFNAAILYSQVDNQDSAKICLDSALMIFTQTNNIHGIANVYNEKAKKLIQQKDFKNAIALLNKSLELRKEVGNLIAEAQTLLELSEFYSESGD